MPGPRPDPTITPELTTWLAAAGLAVKGSYRVDELAVLLQVSRRCIYRMIDRGELDGITLRDRQRHTPTRIPIHSVACLLDRD
ncbi:MAG: helix-turn-helix domain-containing protein [Lamprocystis purpurea]|jgi:excisionase family DNA binding protein|uniref:helix-turn-helix domain-containing protein n=1 Tax=Lamprocystis purpurea TaxID=61598 RepID=UPI000379EE81|nr:helix-turn-helix domain-containing protein [Lamprocystis purpurea]MBV5274419.1 helix-turn-helix domain-containing protein [Lamprocystis purpurea]